MEIAQFFGTPLIIADVSGAMELNKALKLVIAERRQRQPAGLGISNRLGWHSDTRMIEWGSDAAVKLMETAIELTDRYTIDTGASDQHRYAWVPEMWANVSGYGASNQFHCHPGAFWAAVYYVDDGYGGSPDRGLGGEIELEDPRMPMILMEGPDLRFSPRKGAPVSNPEVLIRPTSGKMLLFPGWLRHGVRPYLGRGERISIAINLTAVQVRT